MARESHMIPSISCGRYSLTKRTFMDIPSLLPVRGPAPTRSSLVGCRAPSSVARGRKLLQGGGKSLGGDARRASPECPVGGAEHDAGSGRVAGEARNG